MINPPAPPEIPKPTIQEFNDFLARKSFQEEQVEDLKMSANLTKNSVHTEIMVLRKLKFLTVSDSQKFSVALTLNVLILWILTLQINKFSKSQKNHSPKYSNSWCFVVVFKPAGNIAPFPCRGRQSLEGYSDNLVLNAEYRTRNNNFYRVGCDTDCTQP